MIIGKSVPRCTCCGSAELRPSWMGKTSFKGREFSYLECGGCSSLHCCPMPDEAMLSLMYGEDFKQQLKPVHNVEHPKDPAAVLAILRSLPVGRFMDYGCGSGELLSEVRHIGWSAIGLEYDRDVAASVAAATKCSVYVPAEAASLPPVDVLHLGDVVEHLTDIDRDLLGILRLVKPGGILIAEGPLEAGPTLFNLVLRIFRRTTGRFRQTEMAPYHVLLATVEGQRAMFKRFNLREIAYRVSEAAWPAQTRLQWSDLRRPRTPILFAVRKVSQLCSAVAPGRFGNRYFFVGSKAEGA